MKLKRNSIILIIILFFIAIVFETYFSTSTSPLYGNGDYDSCGYILMGMELANGNVPYISITDNKGPILWIFEAIGQFFIMGKIGVYITQCVCTFICLILIAKIMNNLLQFNKKKQLISCILYLFFVAVVYEGGNFTEEYSNIFIILSIYAASLYVCNKSSISKIGLIIGICASSVILIRINDVISILFLWFIIILGLFFTQSENKWKNIKKYIIFNIIGATIVCVPIFVYYFINNAVTIMIKDYFLIGFGYAKNNLSLIEGIISRIKIFTNTLFGKVLLVNILLSIISAYCIKEIENNEKSNLKSFIIIFVSLGTTIAAVVKPTAFGHYLIPASISYTLSISTIIWAVNNIVMQNIKYKNITKLFIVTLVIVLNITLFQNGINSVIGIYFKQLIVQSNKSYDDALIELASVIDEEEKNKGIALQSPKWYLVTQTRPIIRYIWTDTLLYNEDCLEEFLVKLMDGEILWIVIENNKGNVELGDKFAAFFEENYEIIKENDVGKVYHYKEK